MVFSCLKIDVTYQKTYRFPFTRNNLIMLVREIPCESASKETLNIRWGLLVATRGQFQVELLVIQGFPQFRFQKSVVDKMKRWR